MIRHVGLRLLLLIPSILLASLVLFGVMRALPGDVTIVILSGGGEGTHSVEVREALRHELGLDKPLPLQYVQWLQSMLTGDLGGRSLITGQSVRSIVARQAPVTALLTLYVLVLSIAVSLPAGILAALRRDQWPDYAIRTAAVAGQGIPGFWLALV
ncbi:MAG: ABC transporter permease, partial [Chloroflexi bacterium]|nr:ABC transporter permease [Chloroflexota bacterium]